MNRLRVRFGEGNVLQLRIELQDVVPTVWRRALVSARASLHELHAVIQGAMNRETNNGYRFDVDGVSYGDPEDGPDRGHDASTTALEALGLHIGASFMHVADDHQEPWRSLVTLEQDSPRLVGQRLPVCIAAGRAAPPVDCAGPAEYRRILAALADPLDPGAADLRSWLPEHFDPAYASVTAINALLARIPRHRPAA